jgi:hypothetical protein
MLSETLHALYTFPIQASLKTLIIDFSCGLTRPPHGRVVTELIVLTLYFEIVLA